MVAQIFNPSTWEGEAGKNSVSMRSASITHGELEDQGYRKRPCLKTSKKQNQIKPLRRHDPHWFLETDFPGELDRNKPEAVWSNGTPTLHSCKMSDSKCSPPGADKEMRCTCPLSSPPCPLPHTIESTRVRNTKP